MNIKKFKQIISKFSNQMIQKNLKYNKQRKEIDLYLKKLINATLK